MAKKRVVLANMPQMLAAIVASLIDRQPDMSVVGEIVPGDLSAVAALRPEAVILAPSRHDPQHRVREGLRRTHPGLTLLELRPRDDRAVVWSSSAGPAVLELTAAAIVGAVRGGTVDADAA